MRKYIFAFLLMIFLVILFSSNDITYSRIPSKFEVLKKNEVLAYSAKYNEKSWSLILYRIDTITKLKVVIAQFNRVTYWNGILSGVVGIQFSVDKRICYISTKIPNQSEYGCMIYYIDGNNGIINVLVDNSITDFRTSRDGKFLLCENDKYNKNSKNEKQFLVYGPNGKGLYKSIYWKENYEMDGFYFAFRRDEKNFKIIEYGDAGEVYAVATIDNDTWELKIEYFENNNPNYFRDKAFRDDVLDSYMDKRLNIGS